MEYMTPPPDMVRSLIYIRELFNRGMLAQSEKTPIGNLIACHHYDMAIEFLLRSLSEYFIIGLDRNIKFKDLFNEVNIKYNSEGRGDLPLKSQIFSLREARNAVQHNAEIPHDDNLERYQGHTYSFLSEIALKLFGIDDLSKLHNSELIKDVEIKEHIIKALAGKNDLDIRPFFDNLLTAYLMAIDKITTKIIPNDEERPFAPIPEMLGDDTSSMLKLELRREFGELKHLIIVVSLNTDLKNYFHFFEINNHALAFLGGTEAQKPSDGDKEFCELFVISEIVRWGL